MRLPRLACFAAATGIAALSRGASLEDRVEALFRPPLAERSALTPDGQRIAYTVRDGANITVTIMDLDPPGSRRRIAVEPERDPALAEEPPPVELRFLRWATNSRLVFAPVPRMVPLPPIADKDGRLSPNPDGPLVISPIFVTDADGRQRGTLIDARHFQETPAEARRSLADLLRTTKELQATRPEAVRWRMPQIDILGFHPRDREQLVIRTHGAYSVPTQHLVDVRTGNVREFGDEWPAPPGDSLLFDGYRLRVVGERKPAPHPAVAWRDDELARVQRELETKFPRRIVEILDWSETRGRVLFRVTGGSDAGRIFVYQRKEDLALEVLRRMPWLRAADLHETRFFDFSADDGARLTGYVTWPRGSTAAPPLLVVFPTGFPGRAQPAFDPEAQVFAELGFAVLRLNHRAVSGARPEDLTRLRAAVDRVSVEDAQAAIEKLAAQQRARPFDRSRVVALGRGFGGYLALRAAQLEPDRFRAVVAIDAPVDLRRWLRPAANSGAVEAAPADIPAALIDHAESDWKNLSVLDRAETLSRPVLFLGEASPNPAIDAGTTDLLERLRARGLAAERIEAVAGSTAAPPSPAGVYRNIGDFLSRHLNPAGPGGSTEDAR